jgi:hypothetical protein
VSELRDDMDRAAGADDRPLDLEALHGRARARRARRRGGLVGGVVALALLGTAGIAGLGDDGGRAQQVTASDGGDSPSSTTETTAAPTTDVPATTAIAATSTTAPSGEPTTTSTPMTVAPTVPPTTAPDGITEVSMITGTYRGTGPTWSFSERCADLTHTFDGEVTLADGERWAMHQDYCGRVDQDDRWTGEGTFTFTTPDGATVSGTFTSRAQLPTDGEPYRMTITGGTGGFTGARGTCDMDNHVEERPAGTNQQWGDLRCTFEGDPIGMGGELAPATTAPKAA